MKFGLKWVHMARYALILKQDGAIWLRIILKPLLTPKGAIKDAKIPKKILKSAPHQPSVKIECHLRSYSIFVSTIPQWKLRALQTLHAWSHPRACLDKDSMDGEGLNGWSRAQWVVKGSTAGQSIFWKLGRLKWWFVKIPIRCYHVRIN